MKVWYIVNSDGNVFTQEGIGDVTHVPIYRTKKLAATALKGYAESEIEHWGFAAANTAGYEIKSMEIPAALKGW